MSNINLPYLKGIRKLRKMGNKINFLDYYRIILTILMIVLGFIILYRSYLISAPFIAYIVGLSFILFGIYRTKSIIRFFKDIKK